MHDDRLAATPCNEVVGDVEQRPDEALIPIHSFGTDCIAVGRRCGALLDNETALRPDRNDHCVLDHLGFHQTQHLGTEIFATVTPTEATSRHRTGTEMDTFDARRTHEDFKHRAGLRQESDRRRIEFDSNLFGECTSRARAIGIRSRRGVDQHQHGATNAIVIERWDPLEPSQDIRAYGVGDHCRLGRARLTCWVEARGEQVEQCAGDWGKPNQHFLDVLLAERKAGLLEVAGIGSEYLHLSNRDARSEHQAIQPIGLHVATE